MKTNHFLSHRPASSTRQKLLLAAPVLVAAAPGAQAAIIFTSVNGGDGLTIDSSQKIYFSPATQGYQTTFFSAYDFSLQTVNGNPIIIGNASNDRPASYTLNIYLHAFLFTAGTSINSSSGFLSDYAYLRHYGTGQWDIGSHGYLGFRMDGTNYGWAEVSYNAGASLTLYGFAYEDTGAAINAGVVPEPAETAGLAGLVAGSAAAFAARRRRKAQKAA